MAKKEDKQSSEIKKIEELLKDNPVDTAERDIQVIQTSQGILILLDKSNLYSLQSDSRTGEHYLLELSCVESVRKPKQ